LGAHAGSLGACGIKSGGSEKISRIVADRRLRERQNMVTGANRDDVHFRGVDLPRDIAVDVWADLHTVKASELCVKCAGPLSMVKGLEIGHIFKLGTRYSEAMSAYVLNAAGEKIPLVMGCYGIGVERLMAAVAELRNDDKGLFWPVSIAPFTAVIVPVNCQDAEVMAVAEGIYAKLTELGIDTVLDDRDERAGVKFNDADLVGIPYRITVGKKIKEGQVELLDRSAKHTEAVAIEGVVELLQKAIST
jgi:prolyl-tRNA synthetase